MINFNYVRNFAANGREFNNCIFLFISNDATHARMF